MRYKMTLYFELYDDSLEKPRTAEEIQAEMRKHQRFECPAVEMRMSKNTAETVEVTDAYEVAK